MDKFKTHLFCIIGGIIIGLLIAMGVSRCHRQPIETKVERDTIVQYDTVPHYYPKPVGVTKTKTEYRWLTRVEHSTDTLMQHDSVLVEVPIESRHYHSDEYDAYISGYEPSLDSIFIRQRTEYITETITKMKPPNKLSLDVTTGLNYLTNDKKLVPFLQGELTYKPSKVAFGIQGGIYGENKELKPYVAGIMKFKIL